MGRIVISALAIAAMWLCATQAPMSERGAAFWVWLGMSLLMIAVTDGLEERGFSCRRDG